MVFAYKNMSLQSSRRCLLREIVYLGLGRTPDFCLFRSRMYDNMSTMVCVKEDRLEKLTQDEIISKTKQVIQGLEALKNEHNSILQSLLETLKCLKKDDESNLVEEKSNMIRKSLEMLELGLSEAQVGARAHGASLTTVKIPPE